MKEQPPASLSPEQKKPGPNQADIDALYLKMAHYEPPEAATDPVVRALLAQDGLEFSETSIAAGHRVYAPPTERATIGGTRPTDLATWSWEKDDELAAR